VVEHLYEIFLDSGGGVCPCVSNNASTRPIGAALFLGCLFPFLTLPLAFEEGAYLVVAPLWANLEILYPLCQLFSAEIVFGILFPLAGKFEFPLLVKLFALLLDDEAVEVYDSQVLQLNPALHIKLLVEVGKILLGVLFQIFQIFEVLKFGSEYLRFLNYSAKIIFNLSLVIF
jgi:hypothetical protein